MMNNVMQMVLLVLVVIHPSVAPAQIFKPKDAGSLTGQRHRAGKHFRNGKNFLKAGDKYNAACSFLDALDIKPGKKKFVNQLRPISKGAYEDQIQLCQAFSKAGNHRFALKGYQHLEKMIASLQRHHLLNFMTVDIGAAIQKSNQAVAEQEYVKAEAFFGAGEWLAGINAYRQSLSFVKNYKDSHQKIAECYHALGEGYLVDHKYRLAAQSFLSAHKEIVDYKESKRYSLEIYYRMAEDFMGREYYRAACRHYKMVMEIDPMYRDTQKKLELAKRKGVKQLYFNEFKNNTGHTVGGMAPGAYIFQELRSVLKKRSSPFLTITSDPASAHYLANGSSNQVYSSIENHEPVVKSEQVNWYTKSGEQTIQHTGSLTYQVQGKSREVAFAGNVTVVHGGRVIFSQQVSEREVDSVSWADITENDHLKNYASYQLEQLLAARRDLRSETQMVQNVIRRITDKLANQVLNLLDSEETPTDPQQLVLNFNKEG